MPPEVAHGGDAPPAGAGPNQPGQPLDAAVPGAAGPPTDPYADQVPGQAPDRYGAAPDAGAPVDPTAPVDSAPPVNQGAPGGDYAPPAGQDPTGAQGPPNGQAAPAAQGPPGDVAPAATVPGSGAPSSGEFHATMAAAQRELEGGQLASALRQLSSWYDHPQLAPQEQQQLNSLLDQVAGTVVYSTQNLLEPPYEVQPGEKLRDIGDKYNVPWQLLAKINGIDDPQSLRPGERLKVVRGPFAAVVSLEKREMAVLLSDGSYAGRFKIGIGVDQPPREGVFAVSDKATDPVYRGRDRAIPPHDPNNPLGARWIGLGSELGIHGTNRPESIGRTDLPGSISLDPRDIEDVFDILSVGSKVTIRR